MSDSEDEPRLAPKKRQIVDDDDDEEEEDEGEEETDTRGGDSRSGGATEENGGDDDEDEEEEEEAEESDDDDDDDDDDEEEEEEVEQQKASRSKEKSSKRKEKHKSSSSSSSKGGRDRKRKREKTGRRRHRGDAAMRRYVDLEANVGGDEDDEDDGDYEMTEAEANRLEREALYKPRQKSAFEEQVLTRTDQDIEEYYRDRARPMYRESTIYDTAKGAKATAVVKQAIMPAPGVDPSMWRVKTRPGKETFVIMSIMNMAVRLYHTTQRVGITSAVYGGGNGVVYLEAKNESDVSACLTKVQQLLSRKPELISYGVMPEVMDVGQKLPKPIVDGQWVRLKRGLYKGDLARVLGVIDSGNKYLIELIPRIDYGAIVREGFRAQNFYIAKKGARPEQRFFSATDAAKYGIRVDEERNSGFTELGKGDMYCERMYLGQAAGSDHFRQGYLIKAVKAQTQLETEVTVEAEEVARFGLGALTEDLDAADRAAKMEQATLAVQANSEEEKKKLSRRFNLSDKVVVIRGELKNLQARVVETNLTSGTVTLTGFKKAPGMPDRVEMPASDLAHLVEVGNHVKVLDGIHAGVTGMVQAMGKDNPHEPQAEDNVYLLTDLEQNEIVVRRDQVKASDEMESGYSEESGLGVFSLVQDEFGKVSMVLQIYQGIVQLLDMDNKVEGVDRRTVVPFQSRSNFTSDANNAPLKPGDGVEIDDRGEGSQKIRGVIKHMYNGTLWIKSKQVSQNNGYVAVRARNVFLEGGGHTRSAPLALNATIAQNQDRGGGRYNNDRGGRGFGGGGRGFGGGGGRGGRGREPMHPLIGKEVRISGKSDHKGKTGKVKSVNVSSEGVETFGVILNKMNSARVVMFTKDQIKYDQEPAGGGGGGRGGRDYGGGSSYGGRTPSHTPGYGGQTPGYGSMTPGYGSQTPGYGSMTPSHYGGATPSHYGSQTPGRDGGRSPYHS